MACGYLHAQRSLTPPEVETGGELFRTYCVNCHGPDGDLAPGSDFSRGQFRRAKDDRTLVEIILRGIPGTGMPPNESIAQPEAERIAAYLHYLAKSRSTLPRGDVIRGMTVFQGEGECFDCHRVRGAGSRLGPDLTDIGLRRRAVELERSLLDPDAEILPENRMVKLVTKSGTEITGRLLNLDTFSIQIMDSGERLRFFPKADLKEYSLLTKSPMPSVKGKLEDQQIADLVAYLVSLKGVQFR